GPDRRGAVARAHARPCGQHDRAGRPAAARALRAAILRDLLLRRVRQGRARGGRGARAGGGRRPRGHAGAAGGTARTALPARVRAHRRRPRDGPVRPLRTADRRAGGRRSPQRYGQGDRLGAARGRAAAARADPVRERTPLLRAGPEGRGRGSADPRRRGRAELARDRAGRGPADHAGGVRAPRRGQHLHGRRPCREPALALKAGAAGATAGALPFRSVRPRLVPILISLAAACLIGLLIYGVSTQSASRTLDTDVHQGLRPAAPDAHARLPVLGGHGVGSLAAMRGQVVVLNFWASWCEPCEREAPLLERAQPTLRHYRGTVLGVTYKDATPDSEAFVHSFHLTYPSLRDGTGSFASAYGTD